jgi:L-alanine-DL-glutamate epimerase-like enolase superfamily enzyme
MRITRVHATPLNIPVRIDVLGLDRETALSVCVVEMETDAGVTGHGFTAITEEEIVATAINEVARPALIGADPLDHERLWERLYWLLAPRGQTGYAMHAIAALDIALWDIKGKHLRLPIWRLLGGARDRVPVYATFGFGFFDRDQLAAAAKLWVAQGFRRLKMTVGHQALARRDEPRPIADVIAEDAARIRAVREAVGAGIELYIDANCGLDGYWAEKLCRLIEPYDIAFFEEPVTQNDVLRMAELRRRTKIPLACGQNEGLAFRFRDLLLAHAVDVVQPNVAITGGFTQCAKIAGMASAFNVPIANGGAWPWHNMHLQGGLANGTLVEYHYVAALLCQKLYENLPKPESGYMPLPSAPGLGFELDRDALRELAKLPTSRGKGKG